MDTLPDYMTNLKYGILVETCSLCGRRQAACKPASGALRVCRRCALEALPPLIAQAVLADPETRRPLLGGLEAADEVRKNYEYAVLCGQLRYVTKRCFPAGNQHPYDSPRNIISRLGADQSLGSSPLAGGPAAFERIRGFSQALARRATNYWLRSR